MSFNKVMQTKNYVQRINDSLSFAIRKTISHLAAFFIIAVTKRFNVNRFTLHVHHVIKFAMNKQSNKKSK